MSARNYAELVGWIVLSISALVALANLSRILTDWILVFRAKTLVMKKLRSAQGRLIRRKELFEACGSPMYGDGLDIWTMAIEYALIGLEKSGKIAHELGGDSFSFSSPANPAKPNRLA